MLEFAENSKLRLNNGKSKAMPSIFTKNRWMWWKRNSLSLLVSAGPVCGVALVYHNVTLVNVRCHWSRAAKMETQEEKKTASTVIQDSADIQSYANNSILPMQCALRQSAYHPLEYMASDANRSKYFEMVKIHYSSSWFAIYLASDSLFRLWAKIATAEILWYLF